MEIKVLGPGCAKCKATADLIARVADETGKPVTIDKVEDMRQIVGFGVHKNQQEYGTIYNTLAGETDLVGTIRLKNWNSSQTGRCGERKYHVKDYSTSLSR